MAADSMSARTAQRQESRFRKWSPLMVLSLALSTLIRELNTDLQSLQWVISAYSLMLAALTVTGGRMGDLFGRKKMFMGGAVIFAVGSFIASISRSVPVLLLGESIIEGIGAALMMPATASLLVSKYRGHDRAIAFGIWGGVAAAASATGLFFVVFGIIESETYGWLQARQPFPIWQPGSISVTPISLAIGAAILI